MDHTAERDDVESRDITSHGLQVNFDHSANDQSLRVNDDRIPERSFGLYREAGISPGVARGNHGNVAVGYSHVRRMDDGVVNVGSGDVVMRREYQEMLYHAMERTVEVTLQCRRLYNLEQLQSIVDNTLQWVPIGIRRAVVRAVLRDVPPARDVGIQAVEDDVSSVRRIVSMGEGSSDISVSVNVQGENIGTGYDDVMFAYDVWNSLNGVNLDIN